jgi:hypothetical protein
MEMFSVAIGKTERFGLLAGNFSSTRDCLVKWNGVCHNVTDSLVVFWTPETSQRSQSHFSPTSNLISFTLNHRLLLPMSRSALFLTALLSSCCLLSGCGGGGPPSYQLKGKVTVKGEPAQNVTISLYSQDGQVYSGKTGDDGAFTISGVVPGEMAVTITSSLGGSAYQAAGASKSETKSGAKYGAAGRPVSKSNEVDPKMKEKMKEMLKEQEDKMPVLPPSTKISAKYSDKSKSGLTWNVTPEQMTKDFDLPE